MVIIDGQQRLTTLSIIATRLHGFLEAKRKLIANLDLKENLKNWLSSEIKQLKLKITELAFGTIKNEQLKYFPFPRIIRHDDNRASTERESEYNSIISRYLFEFYL